MAREARSSLSSRNPVTSPTILPSVLLNLCFFSRRDDFLCGLRELIQLVDAASGGGENRHENGTPDFGDLITVGAGDFLNESMGPQHSEFPADGSGAPSPLRRKLCRCAVEQPLYIPVAESVDCVLSVIDRGEQVFVVSPGTQAAHSPPVAVGM